MFRRVHDFLRQFSSDHTPTRMPWFRSGLGSTPIDQVHRLGLRLERSDAKGWADRAVLLLRTLLFPLVSVYRSVRFAVSHGGYVQQTFGTGRIRQVVQMVACANLHNVGAEAYYAYQLFRDDRRRWAGQILQPFEALRIGRETLLKLPSNDIDPKVAFYRRCRGLGLPTAPIIATFASGDLDEWMEGDRGRVPPVDVLLKPCDGANGDGVEIWKRETEMDVWRRGDVRMSEAEVLERCRRLSRQTPYLLQPRLENHPAVARLTSGALCTVRVVTCYPLEGSPVEILSVLRMPVGKTDADNFNLSGIAAPIDRDTGRLGQARARDIRRGTWDRHPDTGAPITGIEMPCHGEIVGLCLRAHALFPEFRSIGWDVPLTPQGPLLLEANALWGVEMMQMVHGLPLGPTPVPACLLEGTGDLGG